MSAQRNLGSDSATLRMPLFAEAPDEEDEEMDENNAKEAAAHRASSRYLLQLCLLTTCWDFARYLDIAPLTEVFEIIICKNVYTDSQLPFPPLGLGCKADAVQNELAFVRGWKEAIGQVPAILLALPFGMLADRIGRKPVLLLFLLSYLLSDAWVKLVCFCPNIFPLRLVWLAPLLEAIGGGAQLGASIFFIVAADVFPEKHRAGAFMKISATEMIAQIVATPMAAAMMRQNNWYPLALSSLLIALASLIAMKLPETHPLYRGKELAPLDAVLRRRVYEHESSSRNVTLRGRTRETFRYTMHSVNTVWQNPVIVVLLFVFLLVYFGSQSWVLLLQYISKRYGWDYSTASLMFTLRGFINLGLFAVLMPLANIFASRRSRFSSTEKDLAISEGSCVLLIVGFAIIALAETSSVMVLGLVISALGSSFLVTLRSAMTSLVSPVSVGMLYSATSVAQSIGILISGPLLALAFNWGMSLGGFWIGIPYLLASALHLAAFSAILCLNIFKYQLSDHSIYTNLQNE